MKIIPASSFTILLILVLSTLFGKQVFASRSLVIETYKDTFTNDDDGEVKVMFSGFTDGEIIFVKGAFSKPDSTNYFGFTKKADNWIKNSTTSTDQLSVKIGEWDGKLNVKPDLSDTGFTGSGDYNFKIGFYYYTSGGDLSSVNWSDSKSAAINFVPTPTATPTVTPNPTNTPVPTSIPTSTPTNSPAPSSTPKPQATATKYISPTVKLTSFPTSKQDKSEGIVLGEISQVTTTPIEEKIAGADKKNSFPVFQVLLASGIIFIAAAVVVSMKQIKKTH